jgi:hypothetical protein
MEWRELLVSGFSAPALLLVESEVGPFVCVRDKPDCRVLKHDRRQCSLGYVNKNSSAVRS